MGQREVILGIDLGTSFSTAAAVIDGRLHFALDSRGEPCFPTVVHFPKLGAPIVGIEADRLRETDPQNTFFGFKRVIGRTSDSPAARVLDASAPFKVIPRPGQEVAVKARAAAVTATELAAIVLRHLKDKAVARFGRPISKAVLTIPVKATPVVREAMVKAAARAELEVVRLVSEPVAGAVAHGANGKAPPFMVYDFGGGTFDATVVRGNGEGFDVLSASGDDCLGGDDFDLAFARWVANGLWRVRKVDTSHDAALLMRVMRQCEVVKRALSTAPSVRYQLKDACPTEPRDLDTMVTRDQLKDSWGELVGRAAAVTEETVTQSQLAKKDLAGVLLIGGTTYVQQVRESCHTMFNGRLIIEKDPQTAVARGAAILAMSPKAVGREQDRAA